MARRGAVVMSGSEGRRRLAGLTGRFALRKPGRLEKAVSRLWPTGLEGVVGYPGAGKTYWLTLQALAAMRKGRAVYANYPIVGANLIHVDDLRGATMADLAIPRGSLVIIDEAGVWFNSRQWAKFEPEDLLIFMQGRKVGLQLLWSAQRLGSVDVTIRELTATVWCGTWYPSVFNPMQPMVFQYHSYRRHLLEDVWEPGGTKWVIPRRRVYEAFDTETTVGVRNLAAAKASQKAGAAVVGRRQRKMEADCQQPAAGPPAERAVGNSASAEGAGV